MAVEPVRQRVVLVTGAASGIGRAIAERLHADGLQVVSCDITVAEVPGLAVTADLTTREGNRDAVAAAVQHFGRLDAVIANAGIQHVASVAEFPEDRWDTIVALLLTSPFLLAKYAWPALAQAPEGGRFLAVASAHALVASPYKAAYVAAKHGVLGLVRTLALEGATQGITATALCPGFVRTPLVERQIADQARAHGIDADRVLDEVVLAPHAVKRLLEPAEVAEAVAFLLGPTGVAFTGAALPMDLGWTAR